MNRFVSHILGLLCFIGTEYAVMANPTGGQVAAGAASIAGQGTSAVEVKQASNLAIINWQTFSIASGESTTFVQPSAASATLNRVLGGETSLINGTLSANGSIFLINGNGTVVGPGGVVRANAFTDSTRDISDDDFLAGNLHFVGSNPAGVQNFGTIHALGGDVVLIGKTVDNEGTITAVKGTAGLVAGDDVLLGQKNGDGSTIKVNPDTFAATDQAAVGIKNTGKVLAASAELKSANGNIYALAIQNEGTIRATTVKKQGGHIWMTSDSGTILNSGTLDASARSAHGHGGSVAIQAANGAVENTGHILAAGGRYGIGGLIETSGHAVQLDGTINAGQGGQWLIDPVDLTIDSGAATTIEGALNGGTSVVEVTTATGSSGAGTTTTGSGNIDVDSGINWATSASLTLSAYDNINVNANIVSSGGGAVILRADNTATGIGTVTFNAATISTSGPVSIFYNPNNPGGTNPRTINGTEYTTPTNYGADVTGGAALTSYMLVNNVDDLQNAQNNLNGNYALGGSIDATATAGWNGGAGFNPIGNQSNSYNGIFDGQGYTIDGLTINRPSSTYTGLFSNNSAGSVLENIGLINENLAGASDSGGLVGSTRGIVDSCYVEGTVTATGNFIGGLAGLNYGTVKESFFNGQVNASGGVGVGGLLGVCVSGGTATMDYSTGTMNTSSQFTGGLVGSVEANGSVTACYSSMQLESAGSNSGGLIGFYGINPGPVQNNYWLHDGVNSGLSGIGSTSLSSTSPSNSSASPETLAQLQQESTFQPMGTGAGQWDFTPGTGVWVIGGNFNNGTPYFRYQVIAVVLTADDQTTYYSGTNTGVGFSNSGYALTSTDGTPLNGDYFSSGPTLTVSGSNVNAGTTNAIDVSAVPTTSNISVEYVNGTENIDQRPITVAVNSGGTSEYGATPTDPGVSLANGTTLATGDTLTNLGIGDDFNLTATTDAGTYTINPTGYTGLANYVVTPESASYVISQRPITVAVNPGGTSFYGNTPTNPGVGLASGTLVNGDTLSGLGFGDSFNLTSASNAGNYTISPTGYTGLTNYTVTPEDATYAITQRPITVVVNPGSSTYGMTPTNPGESLAGGTTLVNGDTLNSLGIGDNFNLTAQDNVGTYTISPTGYTGLANYTVTPGNGTFSINPATLLYVASPVVINLGGAVPPLSGSVTGFVNGDSLTSGATSGSLIFTTAATGRIPGKFAIDGSGLSAQNYVFAQAPENAGAFTVRGFEFGSPVLPDGSSNRFMNFSSQFNANANYQTLFTESWFPLFVAGWNDPLVPVFSPDNVPLTVYTDHQPRYSGMSKTPSRVIAFGSSFQYLPLGGGR